MIFLQLKYVKIKILLSFFNFLPLETLDFAESRKKPTFSPAGENLFNLNNNL